ncbi:MAG: UDP-N-acetylmuramate dehydrogenase [Christensenellales bacterium]
MKENCLSAYGSKCYKNVSAKEICSFKGGGIVKRLFVPLNADELIRTINTLNEREEDYVVIGNASDVLILDGGTDNAICTRGLKNVVAEGNSITAAAGVSLAKLARIACENSLAGFERLAGIPGSVGGAVVTNAGAFGAEISDCIEDITVFDGKDITVVKKEDAGFSYRHSNIGNGRNVVLSVKFILPEGRKADLKNLAAKYADIRRNTQPDKPSAGSVFKRANGVGAGYYIDSLGLKGTRVGGAEISKKHAGFIVNAGDAKSSDFTALAAAIEEKVKCAYGITLEREVIYIGKE